MNESLGLQWASQSYDDGVLEADNRVNFGHRAVAGRFVRDAFRVCKETLGIEWLARELGETSGGGFLMFEGDADDQEDAVESVSRLFDLAVELHDARKVRGFEHLLPDLRRRSLYEALAELRAVNDMARAAEDVWFIPTNTSNGRSYDAAMVLCGTQIAVEVKVKLPKPVEEYRPALIVNSLSDARKQLPASGPSLIYLQLASPWTTTRRPWPRSTKPSSAG